MKTSKNLTMYNKKTTVFLALGVAILALNACNPSSKKEEPQTETTEVVQVDAHNSRNSLDYKGVYKGTLPTASGEGMDVVLTLEDSTYTRVTTYVGKKGKPTEEKGNYEWNSEGNTISLLGVEKPNQYFVGENTLTQLDMDGKKIEGELSGRYILRK